MTSIDLPPPERALAVGAHPDDVEFGCGATLAKWAAAGSEIHILVLTDGSKGTWEGDADTSALVGVRESEQHDAAAVLGVAGVHLLRIVDGELQSGLAERARVCETIRAVRPDVVLGHDPWKRYRTHPDHRHAGFLTIDGIVAARDPHFYTEQPYRAHRPRELLLFEAEVEDHFEDVGGFVERKTQALLAHRSQWRSTMSIGSDSPAAREPFVRRIHDQARTAGATVGLGGAEGFKRINRL